MLHNWPLGRPYNLNVLIFERSTKSPGHLVSYILTTVALSTRDKAVRTPDSNYDGSMDFDPGEEPQLDAFSVALPLPYRVAIIVMLGMAACS